MKKSTRFMALLLLVCMALMTLPVFAEATPTEIILSPSEIFLIISLTDKLFSSLISKFPLYFSIASLEI